MGVSISAARLRSHNNGGFPVGWSYSNRPGTDSDSKRRDYVRLLVGDTDSADKQVTDEEINLFLSQRSNNVKLAAADVCEAIAAKYARQVSTTNVSLSVAASDRFDHFRTLAKELRNREMRFAEVFAGGRTHSGKDSLASDSDAVQPWVSLGQDDNPDTTAAEDVRGEQ